MITSGIFCDSINQHLQQENASLYQVIEKNDTILSVAHRKLSGLEVLNGNQTETIVTLRHEATNAETKIKQQRGQKSVLAIVLGVVIVLSIL